MTENEAYGIFFNPRFHPNEEDLRKLALSKKEVEGLEKHVIRCPICAFRMIGIYGEKKGITELKCQKCGYEGPINLAYFRRSKTTWRFARKTRGRTVNKTEYR